MLRLKTPGDVRRALQNIGNRVIDGTIAPQQANAFVYVANAILGSIRIDEQQKKVDELAAVLERMEAER